MAILSGKLLTSGKDVLSKILLGGDSPYYPAKFEVGDSYGFSTDASATAISGTLVHTGYISDITAYQVDADTVRFDCTIEETYGPFYVGNMIFYFGTDAGDYIPFVQVVFPTQVYKEQSTVTLTSDGFVIPGTRLVISIELKHSEDSEVTSVTILTPDYASLITFSTESSVPLGSAMTWKQAVINYDTRIKAPTLVTVDANNIKWGIPFMQQVNDPEFGQLDGGVDGEGYGAKSGEIVNGYYYLTSNLAFSSIPIGGAAYADLTRLAGGSIYGYINNSNTIQTS